MKNEITAPYEVMLQSMLDIQLPGAKIDIREEEKVGWVLTLVAGTHSISVVFTEPEVIPRVFEKARLAMEKALINEGLKLVLGK